MKKPIKIKGFTLLETVIAGGIFLNIIVAIVIWQIITQQVLKKSQVRVNTQQNIRVVIDKMIRDIRHAKKITLVKDIFGEKNLVEFISDRFSSDEKRLYFFDKDKNEIKLEVTGKILWIASEIKDLKFEYYDQWGNPVASFSSIQLIEVAITGSKKAGGKKEYLSFKSKVFPRNLERAVYTSTEEEIW